MNTDDYELQRIEQIKEIERVFNEPFELEPFNG